MQNYTMKFPFDTDLMSIKWEMEAPYFIQCEVYPIVFDHLFICDLDKNYI